MSQQNEAEVILEQLSKIVTEQVSATLDEALSCRRHLLQAVCFQDDRDNEHLQGIESLAAKLEQEVMELKVAVQERQSEIQRLKARVSRANEKIEREQCKQLTKIEELRKQIKQEEEELKSLTEEHTSLTRLQEKVGIIFMGKVNDSETVFKFINLGHPVSERFLYLTNLEPSEADFIFDAVRVYPAAAAMAQAVKGYQGKALSLMEFLLETHKIFKKGSFEEN